VSSFTKLYASPLAVASEFAIWITGAGAAVREKQVPGATLTLEQVYAGRGAVYAGLTVDKDCLRIEASGAAGSDRPRVYFLPWAKGSICRIRPKMINAAGADGNLLFTPNLDGCMVTVEGPPDAPTVYHANSAAKLSDQAEKILSGIENPFENYGVEQELKISNMSVNFEAFQALAPKHAQPSQLPVGKAAHFDIREYGKFPIQKVDINDELFSMEQDFQYGAVFGVRKNGAWEFYSQSFRVQRRTWDVMESGFFGLGTPKKVRKTFVRHTVLAARKFWP
jgi:hypothetical protein